MTGGFRARLLLQVHDELLLEAPEDEVDRLVPVLRETMEGALPLSVPLTVDVKVGRSWEGMTPVSRRDAVLAEADELPPSRSPGSRPQLIIATAVGGSPPGSLIQPRSVDEAIRAVIALDAVTVELEPGIIGLIGANGAGKSTLHPDPARSLPADQGTAEVLGYDVSRHGTTVRSWSATCPSTMRSRRTLRDGARRAHGGAVWVAPSAARERTAEVFRHVGLYEERYRPIGGYSTACASG